MLNFLTRKIPLILLGLATWLVPCFVQAAQITVDANTSRVSAGQEFDVTIRLNAEKENVNALQGRLVFPSDILQMEQIRDGGSVVSFWIDRPTLPATASGSMTFTGMIPGGTDEEHGFIFSVRMKALHAGTAQIEVKDGQVLLNDGQGTPASFKTAPLRIQVLPPGAVLPPAIEPSLDAVPPEPFKPQLIHDASVLDGRWGVVFATQDKGLGIDYFEIKESPDPTTGTWRRVTSPALLEDQTLRSFISVRAVDRLGNVRVVALPPTHHVWYALIPVWVWAVIGMLCVYILIAVVRRRRLSSLSNRGV